MRKYSRNDTSFSPCACHRHWQHVKRVSFCRTYSSYHPAWHHGLKPSKNPNLLFPLGQNLQRKVSGQGKVTLLLSQSLGRLLTAGAILLLSHFPTHVPLHVLWPRLPDARQEGRSRTSLSAATYRQSCKSAPSACTLREIISCMKSAALVRAGFSIS